MKTVGHAPNVVTYTTLIKGLSQVLSTIKKLSNTETSANFENKKKELK